MQVNATEIARQTRPNGLIRDEVRVVCRETDKTKQEPGKIPNEPRSAAGRTRCSTAGDMARKLRLGSSADTGPADA